jgi:hypothetical protein
MENNLDVCPSYSRTIARIRCLSRRQRHLSDLMVVCNLSKELGDRASQEALLDWLVRHAAEFVPVAFSKV